jgi:alkylation response protein AidB-like acyl-CoA dehydrogenase
VKFGLTDEQGEIQQTARALLARRGAFERARAGFDAELWAELCTLCWPRIAISAEHGGDLGVIELAILSEELGYALAAVPLVSSAATAAMLERAGSAQQRRDWLPGLADGSVRGALGIAGEALVADAPGADVVVLVDDGVAYLITEPVVEPVETIDPTRGYGRVSGDRTALPGDPAGALAIAATLFAAELVGLCQRALDTTVSYARDRTQFGAPIGSFQAVAHRCAEMLLLTEGSRSAVYAAAWSADADPAALPEAASLAKAAASGAGPEVTSAAIQLHGGIGFTWEADLHWLYKRAQLDASLLGSRRAHHAHLAAARSLAGESELEKVGAA